MRQKRFFQIIVIFLVLSLLQYAMPPSLQESEFTPEQKKRIAMDRHLQELLEQGLNDMEQWVAANTGNSVVPAAAVIVFVDGECLYGRVIRGGENRLFEMASITKTFIALGILQLFERGLISLNDPVSTYLPVRLENRALDSPPVTILHLLTHTAGLVDGTGSVQRSVHPSLPIPQQKFPAGLRFHYSNQGYNILGCVITAVTGMPLNEYLTRNILQPLDMRDSEASEEIAGSAGIRCSMKDLQNYFTMFLHRGAFRGRRIISENTFDLMFRETYLEPPATRREYRGISFRIWKIDGKIVSYHHAAHMNGAGGFMQIFPNRRAGYLFISNPPVYEKEEYYRFYNSLKGRMLRLSDLMMSGDFRPSGFQITLPERGEFHRFEGRFVSPIDGSSVEIREQGDAGLVAVKSRGRQRYVIQPTSRHTFVYIYPDQSERGEIYDFIWRNGSFDALCLKDGYYLREGIPNSW